MVNRPFGTHFAGAPWIEQPSLQNHEARVIFRGKKNRQKPNKPRRINQTDRIHAWICIDNHLAHLSLALFP